MSLPRAANVAGLVIVLLGLVVSFPAAAGNTVQEPAAPADGEKTGGQDSGGQDGGRSGDDETVETVGDTLGWHVVEPGETLQSITEKYLGTPDLWSENHRLNPRLRDPGLLRVGQRLRVIVERRIPARRATIEEVANDVDKNPQRRGWEDAHPGDRLRAPSGIRTSSRSSARVRFDDRAAVILTELTQVFLKELETTVTGVERGEIEIERGQAELTMTVARPDRSDIQIVIGDTVAKPRPGSAGQSETRARRAEAGDAQLMIYGGSSRVDAGGTSVAVPQGMGTTVAPGEAPTPPEKLLPRPRPLRPVPGARLLYRNPRLVWAPVAGAASYTVELCRDAACVALFERVTGITDTVWQPAALPEGELFARITAVAPSGLDGYPSRALRLEVSPPHELIDDRHHDFVDREPPVVVVARVGPGAVESDGTLILGPGARLRLAAHDDASGVASVRYRWNGGPWRVWRGGDVAAPDNAGDHRFELEAADHLEQRADWTFVVRRDLDPPAAPSPGGSAR